MSEPLSVQPGWGKVGCQLLQTWSEITVTSAPVSMWSSTRVPFTSTVKAQGLLLGEASTARRKELYPVAESEMQSWESTPLSPAVKSEQTLENNLNGKERVHGGVRFQQIV